MINSLLQVKLRSYSGNKLEIGSGPIKKKGWITLDRSIGAEIFWDLNRKLPFPDGRFEMIYSSHVLEHFSYKELKKLLSELYRVLEPGGIMSVCVPDASIYIALYNAKKKSNDFTNYQPAFISERPMDILNYLFYMDGQHKHMFDFDSLTHHLLSAGFIDCKLRDFDPSLDSSSRHNGSLYAECRKPQ